MSGRLAFVVVGHVDHGKSTLVGRLLADTGTVEAARVEKVRRICEAQRKPFEYAFLLDALEAEQLQGVTIDVAEVRFRWGGREYVFIDAPGHREFVKNMVTGAAHADAALLLVEAREGVQEQSRRHAYLLGFLGVREVAVVVSKMDLAGYAREAFDRVVDEYGRFLAEIGIRPRIFIPISAAEGENITAPSARLDWYRGPTVLGLLEGLAPEAGRPDAGWLRLPVQDVYKFDDRRIIAGRVESGRLAVGDEVQVWPSGHRARVRAIEAWPEPAAPPAEAGPRQSTGITLDYPLYVQRGDLMADPDHPPRVSSLLAASVFWLGRAPLALGGRYRLRMTTSEREVEVFSITRVIDPVSMAVSTDADRIGQNEAGRVVFRSARPFVFDVAAEVPATGRFVVVDGYDVVGGGIVEEADDLYRRAYGRGRPRSASITPVPDAVTPAERAGLFGHRSHVVWLTGVPGSGKSTVARALERQLHDRHVKAFVLDGESLRFGLSADLGFDDVERSEQARRVAEVARLFQLAGLVVIVALVSPFAADREHARRLVGPADFTLVHLTAPAETLRQRDPHGLYRRAGRDAAVRVPGLNAPYEVPAAPDLAFDTAAEPPERVVGEILARVLAAIG